jgi:hypothetical protein
MLAPLHSLWDAPLKLSFLARHWWLTHVILDAQEAEIRRITIRSQPVQILCETLSQKKKNHHKKGRVE